jgi:aminoglycoside phosphotransferase (APT) family kinase protein
MSPDAAVIQHGLARLIHGQHAALGIGEPIGTLATALLGAGESNLSLRVDVNGQPRFTARLAYRPEADAHLAHEFADLALLPPGIGPTPLHLDLSRQYVPYPCAILSFVPGDIHVDWPSEDLQTHAATLARLHQQQMPCWGATDDLHNGPFDMHERFRASLTYWRTHHPELFEIAVVERLVPRLDAYFAAHNDLFTALPSFSPVHGDLCVPNILFDRGAVRYIDWEWMEYGDPAMDVAQLGWDIANPPWQLCLVGERLDAFLGAYLAHRPDPVLPERRKVWITYFKFFDHLHFRTRAAQQVTAPPATAPQYVAAVERIEQALVAQFLP